MARAKANVNQEVEQKQSEEQKVEIANTKLEKKKIDPNQEVLVMNNTSGKLIYVSPRTQNQWIFERYGDEDYMPLFELQTMKSQARKFFEQNWIVVKDKDAYDFLKLDNFYKGVYDPEDLDELFDQSVEDINREIDNASPNVKSLILAKAREKFKSGELTDYRKIKLIEDKLEAKIDIDGTTE
jgi:hypothetical protein